MCWMLVVVDERDAGDGDERMREVVAAVCLSGHSSCSYSYSYNCY